MHIFLENMLMYLIYVMHDFHCVIAYSRSDENPAEKIVVTLVQKGQP
jgi:hypothetical protein